MEERKINFENIDWERAEKIFGQESRTILEQLKGQTQRYPYVKEILCLLAVGTFISGTLVFPGLPIALAPLVKEFDKYQGGRLGQTVKRLKKQRLVEVTEKNGETEVKITQEGMVRALRYRIEEMKINKPKRWDKKWRLIIFDIPEEKKWFREIFREKLKQLELYRLQDSVWVSPYPCFNEIEFLRQLYQIPIEVRYVLGEKIDNEVDLKEYFKL
ncbi:hypothetical protein COT44_03045 [Candidatus Shapirobacteria bacterium CG08_land_8_20_14_0_20_39_18]|uniref:Transcriptional repressor PaaX-like central Cas2-like domain-containing protein n=1 Tax=Candidatus Shapirobacteria bacterium CG08_land_8_20_14_0_20_39_18 TaxID=1974883 RepID=A0A2M6XCJ1_9BACT|nr:MAG: hypothetical protein COT44_03045 [Candidatus Shapirobacteria bacterium CG08_land_8_20_14_0_20_39_18]PIY66492.1 MAG: hypothetical protein COY91_00160 [Candidatus Shapirobacteria bacterium CG_4_10_14_0_8_um_filter_39_15]PJE68500.1 MAG: hypothetical protein COU94_01500 [Candidatus Shapirobacteria bacterium CG10_big_fil_rev_8_21_14_0_10_38_8]